MTFDVFAATPVPATGGFNPMMIVMMLGMLGLLFFMQSRAKKQAAQRDAFRQTLRPGQRVMTQGGLVGTIVGINEATDTVIIDSAGSRCEYMRQGIAKTLDDVAVGEVPGVVEATVAAANDAGVVPAPNYGANVAQVAAPVTSPATPATGGFLAGALGNLAGVNAAPQVSEDELAELDAIYADAQGNDVAPTTVVVVEEEE